MLLCRSCLFLVSSIDRHDQCSLMSRCSYLSSWQSCRHIFVLEILQSNKSQNFRAVADRLRLALDWFSHRKFPSGFVLVRFLGLDSIVHHALRLYCCYPAVLLHVQYTFRCWLPSSAFLWQQQQTRNTRTPPQQQRHNRTTAKVAPMRCS